MNCSFGVGGSIYIVGDDGIEAGCQVKDSFWQEARVNEVSGSSGVNEGGGVDNLFDTMQRDQEMKGSILS